jgi:DNA invertase Pin-like site-specific DNA recombinase
MTPTTPKTQAIGCTRVSTGAQAEAYGQDIQRAHITRHAASLGLELVRVVDEQISGTARERETVDEYYALAKAHKGLHFIFPRVDRIGRRSSLTVGIVENLFDLGAEVHVIGIPDPLRQKENWLQFLVLAAFADYDHKNIETNLKAGKLAKLAQGHWAHGKPPRGYSITRDARGRAVTLEPNAEAQIIRDIFDLAEQGGRTYIMQQLKTRGIKISVASLYMILHNRTYTGVWEYETAGQPKITLEVPQIITPEQFNRVQAHMKRRETSAPPTRSAGRFLLTGFLRCAVCDGAMSRADTRFAKDSKTYEYYKCSRVYRVHGACTHGKAHHAKPLEAQCWTALESALLDPERLRQIFTTTPHPEPTTDPRIDELEQALERAWMPFTRGQVSYEVAQRMADKIQLELDAARTTAQPKATQGLPSVDLEAFSAAFRQAAPLATIAEKRRLMQRLGVRFIVGADGLERLSIFLG